MRNISDILEDMERTGSSTTKRLVRELDAAIREERSRWAYEMQEQSRQFRIVATPEQTAKLNELLPRVKS